ncbi:Putative beta-lactamase/transpeptidase [Colletotrichum destructivum]|uniref:Beta-lactamase/transpeptidase n=1 Tax=Colletotrichum destructivum TaxID=34406 RepID=A0AAX4I199_9PEZI|nr:Putative beta-lactamase/transpeptidase [Colletotrichum destructivum]
MPLSPQVAQEIRSIVDDAVLDPNHVPGTTVVVVDRSGTEHIAHSAGKRGISSNEPMTMETVYWMASCTKMIVGIACMQLVERDLLKLDDSDHLEKLCPELADVKVLSVEGKLVEKKRGITLRMLLTHTSGFGYAFLNERLRNWSLPAGIDEFSGSIQDMKQPLVFQPGESWEYGIGIDWAGIALERASNTKLNDYIQVNVCQPLNLRSVNMVPTLEMKKGLAYMHSRERGGNIVARKHPLHLPLVVESELENHACFKSGGAGIFAKPREYTRILAVFLHDGTCPLTKARILKKETVDEMFTDQIPDVPGSAEDGVQDAKTKLGNMLPELSGVLGGSPRGWGLTFMISGGKTGRSNGTAWWVGLPNLFWWCDRENGVAGMICSHILPFGDRAVVELWSQVETTVYGGLRATTKDGLPL